MESHPQNPEFRINPENFHPILSVSDFMGNSTGLMGWYPAHWTSQVTYDT